MSATTIEWLRTYHADGTFSPGWSVNPIKALVLETGDVGHYCELAGPGCGHCYASQFQPRFGLPMYAGPKQREERLARLELFLDEGALAQVLKRRAPTNWFWEDMSDLFGAWVKEEWIDACLAVMAMRRNHQHIVLTKHPDRMQKHLASKKRMWCVAAHFARRMGCTSIGAGLSRWPLSHVLAGVTVCNQEEATRWLPFMRALDDWGWRTWVSYEPALGPVDWTGWEFVKGFVSGGESGHRKTVRPSHPDWHRATRDFCAGHGIAYHFKQWGAWAPSECIRREQATASNHHYFTGGQHMYRVGKKAAGRLLDGREHNEFPAVGTGSSSLVPGGAM